MNTRRLQIVTVMLAISAMKSGTVVCGADVEEPKALAWQTSREVGLREARAARRPILIRFGGQACPWCRRLDEEIAKPAVQKALQQWTLVSLDVDKDGADARAMNVESIPAMRVLTSAGRTVEVRDGYLPEEKLIEWLNASFEHATEGLDEALLTTGTPAPTELQKILRQFGDRNPTAREAAVRRLMPFRADTAQDVVHALRQEKLSTRLTALELLREWQAPVDDVDPWRPETLTAERFARLETWLTTVATTEVAPWSLTPAALEDARLDIDQMLKSDAVTAAAIRERLARHKSALLPEVVARLRDTVTDEDRSRLLALRYRLVIADSIALRSPDLVERLAAVDVRTRHLAVQELTEQAGADSQPLFLELFADVDPLVRELSLIGLRTAAGSEGTNSLVKLLDDPEPNVRAAVLKQLAENPWPELQERLAKFLQTEKETALLVHAVRCFRKLKTKSPDVLLPLLEHPEWQVRAETLDTLTGAWQRYPDSETREMLKKAAVRDAVIERLGDEDAFVVSRAILGVKNDVTQGVVIKLLTVPDKHPSLLKDVVTTLSTASSLKTIVLPSLKSFFSSPDPTVRAEAIRGMGQLAPDEISTELMAALQDGESLVRIAGATALLQILAASQPTLSNGNWNFRGVATNRADDDDVVESVPASGLTGLFRSLLGGPPPSAPRPAVRAVADDGQDKPDKALKIATERETWLREFRQGKKRTADQTAMIPLLEKMFASQSASERIASAVPLMALGVDTVLPHVAELASSDNSDAPHVLAILNWLTFAEREKVYAELIQLPNVHQLVETLLSMLPQIHDVRDAEFIWNLSDVPNADAGELHGVGYALRQLYFGERYWDTSSITPTAKQRVFDTAATQLKVPASWRHLMALTLMYENLPADPEVALEQIHAAARSLVDDATLPQELRSDALQVALLTRDRTEQAEQLLNLLKTGQPTQRYLALRSLVNENGLGTLMNSHISLTVRNAVPRSTPRGQQIQPEPPAGVTAEMVLPLMSSPDAEARALAGYILALSGDPAGLTPLIDYWRVHARNDDEWIRYVYRAIAVIDDSQYLPVLKQIYKDLETYNVNEFYWTIRIMTGPKLLEFRKLIRDEKGADALR